MIGGRFWPFPIVNKGNKGQTYYWAGHRLNATRYNKSSLSRKVDTTTHKSYDTTTTLDQSLQMILMPRSGAVLGLAKGVSTPRHLLYCVA